MLTLGSIIKKADILNNNKISFTTNNGEKKTVIGGIFNIILIAVFILLNFRMIFKYFYKVDPFLTYITEIVDEKEELILNTNNFPFAFALYDKTFSPMNNTGYFYYTFEYSVFNFSELLFINEQIDSNACGNSFDNIISDEQLSLKNVLPVFQCVDLNNRKIIGNFNSLYRTYFNIYVNQCKSGFIHKITKEKCPDLTEEQIQEEFDKLFLFGLYYPGYFIKNNDLKNPFQIYLYNEVTVLELNSHNTINLSVEQTIMESENVGLLNLFTTNKQENHAVDINKMERRKNSIRNYEDSLLTISFFQSSIRKKYIRSYMSLEELLGNIGGISQVVLIMIDSIVCLYSKNCFYLNMFKFNDKMNLEPYDNLRNMDFNYKNDNINNLSNVQGSDKSQIKYQVNNINSSI